jgi:hypothetical protein
MIISFIIRLWITHKLLKVRSYTALFCIKEMGMIVHMIPFFLTFVSLYLRDEIACGGVCYTTFDLSLLNRLRILVPTLADVETRSRG